VPDPHPEARPLVVAARPDRQAIDLALLAAANAAVMERRSVPFQPKRISRWLVQAVVLATSLFALFDLVLLMTSSHH
jgi:hypothetical protein